MANLKFLEYKEKENYEFDSDLKNFITIIGKSNNKILNALLLKRNKIFISINNIEVNKRNYNKIKKNISFVLNSHLNTFIGETVNDEISFGLESLAVDKDSMKITISNMARDFDIERILLKDPNSLGISDKAKVKIISSLVCKPKILVLDNILSELDYMDREITINILKKYVDDDNNIIINFTSNIEESLYGNRLIVCDEEKIVMDGKTISVLNEEKIMKRLGISLPFIVELNKYLMDYGIIKKYELNMEKLVNFIWK
jgi:energy-coupling factor transporter ATP-binding protein EcfA2